MTKSGNISSITFTVCEIWRHELKTNVAKIIIIIVINIIAILHHILFKYNH
jgi:hypothetical protein